MNDTRTLIGPIGSTLVASLLWCACGPADSFSDRTRRLSARTDSGRPVDHSVHIHVPRSLVAIEGTTTDLSGRPIDVRCATCHSVMLPPPALPDAAAQLGGPHAGLRFSHGANACASCHDPARYDRLRLATGESIAMTDAMRLCTQCHGGQARAYAHGAHGGMQGYWDVTRGPRTRNHCVDCHDPHSPAFPRFQPLPPPTVTETSAEGRHE